MPIYGYLCAHFGQRKTSSRHIGSFSARRGFHAIRKGPSGFCIRLPVQIIGAKYRVWTLRKVNIISLQSSRTFSLRSAVSVEFLFLISLKRSTKFKRSADTGSRLLLPYHVHENRAYLPGFAWQNLPKLTNVPKFLIKLIAHIVY